MATEEDKTPQAGEPLAPDEPPAIDAPNAAADSATDSAIVQCAGLLISVRRLLFLSLGALALTAEEARDFVDRLVERGDLPQGLAQEEVERWVDDLHRQHPEAETHFDGGDSRSDALWGRLRVPTHREIETLSRKIGALDQRLAALRMRRVLDAPPAQPADGATPSEP